MVEASLGFTEKGVWETQVSLLISSSIPCNTERMCVLIVNRYLAQKEIEVQSWVSPTLDDWIRGGEASAGVATYSCAGCPLHNSRQGMLPGCPGFPEVMQLGHLAELLFPVVCPAFQPRFPDQNRYFVPIKN